MGRRRIVLWGLDGILANRESGYAQSYGEICSKISGRSCTDAPAALSAAARTDTQILRETLTAGGVPDEELPELLARAVEELVRAQPERRDALAAVGRPPGVAEALAGVRLRGHREQTLVTGDLEPLAALKVGAVGVDRYLNLAVGGYGSDAEQWDALPAAACAKVEKADGGGAAAADAVLLLSSPAEVTAARAAGFAVVAVATGSADAAELAAAGAELVLPDLSDTAAVLDAIEAAEAAEAA
ncbi:hypothetical protein [Streptomyces sp. NPDC002851]